MRPWQVLTGMWAGINAHPKAAYQDKSGGVIINTPQDLEAAMRGALASAGVAVNPDTAMRVAAVWACVRIISGTVANLPLDIKVRVDEKRREVARDHPLQLLLRRRPNRWQTPSQFKRMMQVHLLLRGNAYALKVMSRGRVIEIVPLNPDKMEVKQNDDWSISYVYTRRDGRRVRLAQNDIMHLVGLTLDGVVGVSPITYARETVGLSLAMERHGASTFRNGARPSHVLTSEKRLGQEGRENLRASLDEYRTGGESEGKELILEEGVTFKQLSLSAQDLQFIESRKFSQSDIFMVYGIAPHMAGVTEKSTSYGTGIEQQTIGYTTFTAEDHLTTWEESVNRDLISEAEPDHYAKFNRAALIRGDFKTRTEGYAKALQFGWLSPNEVRAKEDMNPREDDLGDKYYDPPNTAGGQREQIEEKDL